MPIAVTSARRRGALLSIVAAAVLATAGTASAALKLTVLSPGRAPQEGMQDDRLIQQTDPLTRIALMANAGASIVRVDMRWDQIATARPANPTDPADPAYDWSKYDAIVAAAQANRVEVMFTVYGTPAWAVNTAIYSGDLNRGPQSSFAPGDPADFGRFARAAAARYAPRGVKKWEGWNEPNIVIYLQPQWKRSGNTWVYASPAIYSGLQKEFYAGIKAVDPTAVVAGAVTAPAGDRCQLRVPACSDDQVNRVIPMEFIKALNAADLRPPMDIVSHHPYPVRPKPSGATPKSANYSDLYNMEAMTKAIDSTYLKGKKLWITEYGFATAKVREYRIVVSLAGQAAAMSDAYWRLRTNPRVAIGIYYALQDHPGWKSGLLTQTGSRKVGYLAHAMPLYAARSGRTTILFGQARLASGRTKVVIQRRSGSRWVTAKRLTTAADGGYRVRVTTSSGVQLRATWSGTTRPGSVVTVSSRPVSIAAR